MWRDGEYQKIRKVLIALNFVKINGVRMNVEKLHSALKSIEGEYTVEDIITKLTVLQTTLQQSISSPGPNTTTAFREAYLKVSETLSSSKSNLATPTRRKIFEELNLTQFLGDSLLSLITKTISGNQITPSEALKEIQAINQRITKFQATLTSTLKNLSELGVGIDELAPGEFEIGISIPKEVIKTGLKDLEKEFHNLDFIFRAFCEVSGEEVDSSKVNKLSSSVSSILFKYGPQSCRLYCFCNRTDRCFVQKQFGN